MFKMKRWVPFFTGLFALTLLLAACTSSSPGGEGSNTGEELPDRIRIGYHAWLANFLVAKEMGFFEEEFAADGVAVELHQLDQAGTIIEAIKARELDVSSVVGSFIVAGAASGAEFVVLGTTEAAQRSNAVIVPAGSDIRSVTDLRGKKVAVVSGSNSHFMLAQGLKQAGLSQDDIELVPMQPVEAQAAFESGVIDAWAIWDPFRGAQEIQGAQTLFSNEGIVVLTDHPVALERFYTQYPEAVRRFLKALHRTDQWMKENPEEATRIWAEANGFQPEVAEVAWGRREFTFRPFTDEDLAELDKVAEFYLELDVINEKPDISSRVDNRFTEEILEASP